MVTRDTKLQAGVVLAYFVLLVVVALLSGTVDAQGPALEPVYYLFTAGLLFLVFAGTHLYLAWRGEGGMVPVDARWRFVGVVVFALALAGLAVALMAVEPIAGIRPELPVFVALGALLLGYFVYEAREGYLERKPE